ncbi:hypothetical protein N0V82_001314 [Gnomoniopsis sp. IMI 355080]|nr:hypothetical protein N0V82_001314 [Gnomoniopsis sp. IMI 355080]
MSAMENPLSLQSARARARLSLGNISNSRLNMLANKVAPARFVRNENGNPTGSAPIAHQVEDFLGAPSRTEYEILQAFIVKPDEFVVALLDVFESAMRSNPVVSWSFTLIQLFVRTFGWKITNVLSRHESDGELDLVIIQRPSRAVEKRARARSQASYLRGVRPPLPRTYYEAQIEWLFREEGPEEIVFELRNAPNFVVDLMLENLRKRAMSKGFLYWSPITRVLLDEFDWTIEGGSVYRGDSYEGEGGRVRIAPPANRKG